MADLQDDAPTVPGVGALDPVPATEATAPAGDRPDSPTRASVLLAAHPIADGYNALPWTLRRLPWHVLDTCENTVDTDIPRLRAGGVGAQFWSLLVPDSVAADPARLVIESLEQIDVARTLVRRYPDGLSLSTCVDEMADARNRGRIASFLGPVSGRALTDSLGALRAFHALGVRSVAPAGADWIERGMTAFGMEVVQEINRLAMLIDLAGCGPTEAQQLIAASKAPVLISHTAANALTEHPENVSDEVLTALRAAKGLCMVTFTAVQVSSASPATIHDVADHLDHIREVAGPACVGLGGAYGIEARRAQGLEDASGYPRLIAELLDRGWPDRDISLLAWGNAQRVLRDAEFTARAAQHRLLT
ncbi:dipeptidase [Streptomyces sp. NPDC006879]|uniref:dipeptidase n=1 Tax=Streptomyces sp. NPDC006879 TaxID=3364767 RepID=UPI0036BFD4B7